MDTPTPAPLKSGFFSSEFILHLLPTVVGLVIAILPQDSKWVTLLGGAMALLSSSHYSYLRSNLKSLAIQAGLAAFKVFTDASAGDTTPVADTVGVAPARAAAPIVPFPVSPSVTPSPTLPAKQ